jgi:hypothetical protein
VTAPYIQLSPAQPDSGVRQVSIVGIKGQDTLLSLAGPEEPTVVEPGAPRRTPRADTVFCETVEWLSRWLSYSRATPTQIDFNVDYQKNTVRLFMDGLEVGCITRPTREQAFAAATAHVRWLWSLLLGPTHAE